MKNTEWRDDYRRVVKGRATAYSPVQNGAWEQDMPFTMVYGNGGLLTTVPDLLRWNDALSAGTAPLTREVVSQLETRGVLTDGSTLTYALGLVVDDYRGVKEVSHGGATAGYRTFLGRWPDQESLGGDPLQCGQREPRPVCPRHRADRARTARRAEPALPGRNGERGGDGLVERDLARFCQ